MKLSTIFFLITIFVSSLIFFFIDRSLIKFSNIELKKCKNLDYEETKLFKQIIPSNLTIEIKFTNERDWKRRIIKGHAISYENKKISGFSSRFFTYNKRTEGLVILKSGNKKCAVLAKIRPHGDFLDHRSGLDLPSLNINLVDGNINGITKFILFRPITRHNDNEILISKIFSKAGFLSPRTFNLKVKYNNKYYDFLFQEKIVKEFLEYNNLRESVVIKGDERFAWFDPFKTVNLSKHKISNNKFPVKSLSNSIVSEYSVSLMNNLNRIYEGEESPKIVIDYDTVSKKLEKNYFTNLNTFDALAYAVEAPHALARDDRRFYFDPFRRTFSPIYYDGMGRLLTITNEPVHLNIKSPHYRKIYFNEENKKKFIPSAISGAHNALKLLNKIDISELHKELANSGMNIKILDLKKSLIRIKENLINLEKIPKKRIFKINTNLNNKPFMNNDDQYNKKINRRFIFYDNSMKKFISCNLLVNECKNIDIDTDNKGKLLNQNLKLNEIQYIYVGKKLNKSSNKGWYYQTQDFKHINKKKIYNFPNLNLNIFLDKNVKFKIDKENKVIEFVNNSQDKIVFYDSEIDSWKIYLKKSDSLFNKTKVHKLERQDEYGLTGCLTFMDTKVIDLKINIENMLCEDSVNFIRSHGNIDMIKIVNAEYDAIDLDFSKVDFGKITIENSKNDCLDVSFGFYNVKEFIAKKCGDKGISVGENSKVKILNANIFKSKIALATKDSSISNIKKLKADYVKYCLSAYNKKQEFDGGVINIESLECTNYSKKYNTDNLSKIFVKKTK